MFRSYHKLLNVVYKFTKNSNFVRESVIKANSSVYSPEAMSWLKENGYIERILRLIPGEQPYYICKISDKGMYYFQNRRDRKINVLTLVFAIASFLVALFALLKPTP